MAGPVRVFAVAICFQVALLSMSARVSAANAAGRATVDAPLSAQIDQLASQVQEQMVAWRRDLHEHPELSNREVRTAGVVADHLRKLGLDVRTQVAHTGVVGVLRGGRPGPVVALRADMDALPVTEETGLPFASKVRTDYNGEQVGVMHACGHDVHTAILMAVAQVLARCREQLPGTIVFLLQPAEEGAPRGEQGGAELMIREGALDNPRPAAIFGLHVSSKYHAGTLAYRSGPTMASSDSFRIVVRGRQTHGTQPWSGVDPIVTACQIVLDLQTIGSPQTDLTARMVPTLEAVAGKGRVLVTPLVTGAEDFSFYEQQVPGLYFFLGVTPAETDPSQAPACHSPHFCPDESAMTLGVRALAHLALARLQERQ